MGQDIWITLEVNKNGVWENATLSNPVYDQYAGKSLIHVDNSLALDRNYLLFWIIGGAGRRKEQHIHIPTLKHNRPIPDDITPLTREWISMLTDDEYCGRGSYWLDMTEILSFTWDDYEPSYEGIYSELCGEFFEQVIVPYRDSEARIFFCFD